MKYLLPSLTGAELSILALVAMAPFSRQRRDSTNTFHLRREDFGEEEQGALDKLLNEGLVLTYYAFQAVAEPAVEFIGLTEAGWQALAQVGSAHHAKKRA